MADYWKSQSRRYCDFCKCWIADNKPSIEFHEKGRRHQENVAKKIKYISKKSKNDEKESLKIDAALQQMETAALEAYQKDVENNADLMAQSISKKLKESNAVLRTKPLWHEVKTEVGKSYYWNIITNETIWETPKEGFLSIEDQQKESYEKSKNQLKLLEKQRQLEGRIRTEQVKQEEAEEKARLLRENMKERRVTISPPPSCSGPILTPGKTEPYGQWSVVDERPTMDLQLPMQNYCEGQIIEENEPAPTIEFKEKIVGSLDGGNSTFKKRKFDSSIKRNIRQRLDDE